MNIEIVNLTNSQIEQLNESLEDYDEKHITYKIDGSISIGIFKDGKMIAGLDACMTAFKILYVSTVFVEEQYRRCGYGKKLMAEMERRAKILGANTIRLDTFDWQGKEFYQALHYELVGQYKNDEDHYAEFFFMKRI